MPFLLVNQWKKFPRLKWKELNPGESSAISPVHDILIDRKRRLNDKKDLNILKKRARTKSRILTCYMSDILLSHASFQK
jgi:hypothetical protein